MQQLVANYFVGNNSTFLDAQFRWHFGWDDHCFCSLLTNYRNTTTFFDRRRMLLESLVHHPYRRWPLQLDFWLTDVVLTKSTSGFVLENQQLQNFWGILFLRWFVYLETNIYEHLLPRMWLVHSMWMQGVASQDAWAALTAGIGNGKTAPPLGLPSTKDRKEKVALQRCVAGTTSGIGIYFVVIQGH